MVKLAIKGNPFFEASNVEINREGKSYTIDTVRHFKGEFGKGTKLYFVDGEDNYADLCSWKNIEDILEIVSFIVVNRPGYQVSEHDIRHYAVNMPGIDISASYIRRRIIQGKSIKYLVPDSIFGYIKRHKLFKN